MRRNLIAVLLASAVAACTTPDNGPASRGLESVNQPVLNRSTFAIDLAAPGGVLPAAEMARLDGWFRGLDLGYGDSIAVDGAYAASAGAQVAELAGTYGMMVLPAAPVTAGVVPQDMVRVVVSRTRAEVPGCPNWEQPASPNYTNKTMPNFGCGVNSNLAAMVADPEDLFHGREGSVAGDAATAAKAVQYYRQTPPTGTKGLQDISSTEGK